MVAIGIAYLVFQKSILDSSVSKIDSTTPAQNWLSRTLIGAQVRVPCIEWRQLLIVGRLV